MKEKRRAVGDREEVCECVCVCMSVHLRVCVCVCERLSVHKHMNACECVLVEYFSNTAKELNLNPHLK